jgi:hypothetical protein
MGNIFKKPQVTEKEPTHNPYKYAYSPEEEEYDENKENIPPEETNVEKKKKTNDARTSNKRMHDSQNHN